MPNVIDATGLTVDTATEITALLVAGFQSIYGADINVDQNSADGQRIGIFTQLIVDMLEVAVSVNNNFDPDQAVGTFLDQRVAINNIQRRGGTYSQQPIDVTVNATVDLQGLDANFNDPNGIGYTVQDASGNEFILATSVTLTAGTTSQSFRAKTQGPVNVPINTITIPVTIVLGVVSVNNSSSPVTVGATQETDAQLRVRRQQSVALSTTGYLNGLLGAILALDGVTEASLYENNTGSTDIYGTPAHSIWLIVAGGANVDIANTIYARKSYGASMRGAVTYDITTASGSLFVAQWDVPAAEPLYIRFTLKTTVTGFVFDQTSIKQYLADNLVYGIGAYAETSAITTAAIAAIAAQGGGGVAVLMAISIDGSTYTDYIAAATPKSQFTVATGNISITVI